MAKIQEHTQNTQIVSLDASPTLQRAALFPFVLCGKFLSWCLIEITFSVTSKLYSWQCDTWVYLISHLMSISKSHRNAEKSKSFAKKQRSKEKQWAKSMTDLVHVTVSLFLQALILISMWINWLKWSGNQVSHLKISKTCKKQVETRTDGKLTGRTIWKLKGKWSNYAKISPSIKICESHWDLTSIGWQGGDY